jgi:hypothetical protein
MKTYDPSEVSIIVGGTIIKSWNLVTPEFDEDGWTFSTGTSGESTRTKNLNKMGTITLTLPQSSADNDILSGLQVAGALLPVSIIDKSGSTIITMPEGTIVKLPAAEMAKEAGEREWIIKGDMPASFIGGNS